MAQAQDTNLSKWVCQFGATADERLHFFLPVPGSYNGGGSVTLRLRWRTSATSGDVVWKTWIHGLATNANVIGTAATTGTTTTAAPGTANLVQETVITVSASLAADQGMGFVVGRDGANGSDTCTGVAELLEVLVEWAVFSGSVGYIWVPAHAWAIPSGSSASYASDSWDSSGIINAPAVGYLDSGTETIDAKVTLPQNFSGGLLASVYASTGNVTGGTYKLHLDMGAASVGSSSDPTITAQTNWTLVTGASAHFTAYDQRRAAVISPTAGQELVLHLVRDTSDASTDTLNIRGVLLEFNINARTSQNCLDPGSAAQPTGVTAATLTSVTDTNSTKWVGQFAQGANQALDFVTMVPSLYGSGGTLRVRWRSTAGSGNVRFQADFGNPANAAASDPTLTSGTMTTSASGGAGVLNEVTLDVSSGLVASDMVNIRLWRKGTDGSDTLAATVEVLDVILETVPA